MPKDHGTGRMRKAILMDLDGVVIDSEPLYEKVEKRLYRNDFGLDIPDDDWIKFKGVTEREIYKVLCEKYGLQLPFDLAMEKKRTALARVFEAELELFPDFLTFFDRYKRHFRFALTTSSARSLLDIPLRKFELEKYFESIVCGDDVNHGKPHPEPYLKTAQRLDIAPSECIVIEDSSAGIRSAHAAGCPVIALTTSLPKKFLKEADLIRNSLSEIMPEDLNRFENNNS